MEDVHDLIFVGLLILGFLGFCWICVAIPMRIRAKQIETLTLLIKDVLNNPNLTKEDKDAAVSKLTRAIKTNSEKD